MPDRFSLKVIKKASTESLAFFLVSNSFLALSLAIAVDFHRHTMSKASSSKDTIAHVRVTAPETNTSGLDTQTVTPEKPIAAATPDDFVEPVLNRAQVKEERGAVKVQEPISRSRGPVFYVKRKVTVAWKGQLLPLKIDSVVSDAKFGDGAVEEFKRMGVLLSEKKGG